MRLADSGVIELSTFLLVPGIAIHEVPMKEGEADYLLSIDRKPIRITVGVKIASKVADGPS
jgi:hypothetical protein